MAFNPFTRHPSEVGESYFEHMGVASRVGLQMASGSAVLQKPHSAETRPTYQ